jgi:hypothetical protein
MSSTSLLDELELTQHFEAIVATGKLESVQDDDPLHPPSQQPASPTWPPDVTPVLVSSLNSLARPFRSS